MNTVASEKTVARFFLAVFLVSLGGLWLCRACGITNGFSLAPSLFLFLIAPGFIPSLRIGRKLGLGLLEVLPFAVSLSLGQAALLLLVFDWLGLSVFNATWALPTCTLAWYLWIELAGTRGTEFGAGSDIDSAQPRLSRRATRFLYLALLLYLIAVSVLLLRAGAPLQWQTDAPAHLAAIRGVVEEDRVFPAMQPYGPNGVVKPDPRFGVFHALCALLFVASGTEIYTLWKALPAFFTPFLALGLFSATRSLTGNVRAAFAAAFLFPLCYGGIGGGALRTVGYPNRVSMLPYLVSLAVLFTYLRAERRWLLMLLGILAVTTVAVHVYYFIEFLFVVTCFFLLKFLVSWADASRIAKCWARVVGVTVGISLPFLVYRLLSSYSTANPYSVEGQNLLYLDERFYILNPFKAYGWFGLAGTASLLLLPYFILRARKSDAYVFVTAATAGPLLLIFNPLAMPVASKVLSYLAWRLMWAVPYVLSIGIFVTEFPVNIRRSSLKSKFFSCVGMGLVVAALLGTLNWRVDFYKKAVETTRESFADDFAVASGTLGRLDKEVKGRRVFLSDPVTAYAIPALTRHFVTAIPVAHSAPTDSFPVSRVRDALDVLNPSVGLRRTAEVLRKYGVEYVMVNTGFSERLHAFEYEIDPEEQERVLSKITSARVLFEEIFSEGDLHVFRVTDLKKAEFQEGGLSRNLVPGEADFVSTPIADFASLFSMERVRVSPASVEPGDSVSVHFLWKCLSPLPREDVYKLFIRMDTEFPRGRFFAKSLGKPYRKLLERRVGKRFRLKVDVDPEGCEPPLHLWKRGELVEQVVTFPVPLTLSPGRYSVKANLRRTPASMDFHVSDYLRDEDYFSGVEIGSVVVRGEKTTDARVP
ncbi:MAG: hypothetical protein NTX17_03615 [Candidatus Eisenbacteria bacterium]|nr:hypothetical protein [Candidatus Eisenbacteria bacterium]